MGNKDIFKPNFTPAELSASEEETQNDEDFSSETNTLSITNRTAHKPEVEQETVSCYCSASHTDNLSTDEHDSLRDTHDPPATGLVASDSGADLTEYSRHDADADWHRFWHSNGEKIIWRSWIAKFSAFINPDFFIKDAESQDKPKLKEKFKFDEKELSRYSADQSSQNQSSNAYFSDDDRFGPHEISEGWNPLSPASVECETEVERLLSSRCGSHTSSSLKTVDSMTNVTHLTVSSIDLSPSTDSFSSVSSAQSSVSSEDPEEEYQHQWRALWKQHYEEEYNDYYIKFIDKFKQDNSLNTIKDHKSDVKISKKKVQESLGKLFKSMNISEEEVTSECTENKLDTEDEEMLLAMDLPTSFGTRKFTQKKIAKITKNDSFEASKSRIKAAFNLIGIEYNESNNAPLGGQVDYKIKHIRLQNRHLKIKKNNQHIHFDDDGNVIEDEMEFENILDDDDSSDNQDTLLPTQEDPLLPTQEEPCENSENVTIPEENVRKKRKKKKQSFPPEIKENAKLKKYWHRRFSLFSKFDQGIKLDEESWYSVTPETVAKHTADRLRCDVIVDAFCGAGGNAIQFALQCEQVIAIDIDPKKIDMAKNNAEVYGVSHKIQFIVGDFLQLSRTLKGDVVFLSPPWGGPSYLNKPIYELEEMLQPVPFSVLMQSARQISKNVAAFLPRNSNSYTLVNEAGPGGKVEIEQNFINKKLIAVTAYYNDLIKEDQCKK